MKHAFIHPTSMQAKGNTHLSKPLLSSFGELSESPFKPCTTVAGEPVGDSGSYITMVPVVPQAHATREWRAAVPESDDSRLLSAASRSRGPGRHRRVGCRNGENTRYVCALQRPYQPQKTTYVLQATLSKDAVHEGLGGRRTAWNIDVHRDDAIAATNN